jgi:hypothetical protein
MLATEPTRDRGHRGRASGGTRSFTAIAEWAADADMARDMRESRRPVGGLSRLAASATYHLDPRNASDAAPYPQTSAESTPRQGRFCGRFASAQEWLRIIGWKLLVPNSQTWLVLLAAEPIETKVFDGSGLSEVVHDEPLK